MSLKGRVHEVNVRWLPLLLLLNACGHASKATGLVSGRCSALVVMVAEFGHGAARLRLEPAIILPVKLLSDISFRLFVSLNEALAANLGPGI